MNILVVDDEYYIVKNIIDTTDWQALGIENHFEAYSAKQARKILSEENIDIIITDIEMPQENGLSLITWLRAEKYPVTVIVLTGHQKFDYAIEATNLHVFSYLLKPVNQQEVFEKLEQAVSECKKQRLFQEHTAAIESQIIGDNPATLIDRVKEYVGKNYSDSSLNCQQIAEVMHMNADYLSHTFSTKEGCTLSAYILNIRMTQARLLLSGSDLSLAQIGESCGITNIPYFHRQFKKMHGITPSQYRADSGK